MQSFTDLTPQNSEVYIDADTPYMYLSFVRHHTTRVVVAEDAQGRYMFSQQAR